MQLKEFSLKKNNINLIDNGTYLINHQLTNKHRQIKEWARRRLHQILPLI